MKNFKRKFLIFLIVVVLIIFAVFIQRLIYHKIDSENPSVTTQVAEEENETKEETTYSEDIDVVPTMQDEITDDTAWCGTLSLVWNDLLKHHDVSEIIFDPEIETANNLNKQDFTEENLSEDDYYKVYGLQTVSLKETIENVIKEKFDETSDILDSFEWAEDENTDTYFFYTILKKVFTFEYNFEDLDNGNFEGDTYTDVTYFGVTANTDGRIKNQITILYYNDDEDFAVELKTNEGENIILCNNPQGTTFEDIYNNIMTDKDEYIGNTALQEEDDFKMPDLELNLLKDYSEFEGKEFYDEEGNFLGIINKAIQTIQFKINKEGGSLKSEAAISQDEAAMLVEEVKHLYLDDSFVIFLQEDKKEKPYYASMITDITKFQN